MCVCVRGMLVRSRRVAEQRVSKNPSMHLQKQDSSLQAFSIHTGSCCHGSRHSLCLVVALALAEASLCALSVANRSPNDVMTVRTLFHGKPRTRRASETEDGPNSLKHKGSPNHFSLLESTISIGLWSQQRVSRRAGARVPWQQPPRVLVLVLVLVLVPTTTRPNGESSRHRSGS